MTDAFLSSETTWLRLVRSHDFPEQHPQTFPEHPICARCDVPMWLSKVLTKPKKVEYFYECKACA